MIEIKKYKPDFQQELHEICLGASSNPNRNEAEQILLFLSYNDYYTAYEPQHVLIAYDTQKKKAAGYILGCFDPDLFMQKMQEIYIPQIEKLNAKKAKQMQEEVFYYKKMAKDYPVHLHIDLLDEYQGKHIGTKLMESLLALAKEQKKNGVILGVSKNRPGAIAFYKKCGFVILDEDEYGLTMVQNLQ